MKHAAKKSLGQNFLKSKKALSDMVNAGKVSKGDTVLEIGPGKGALTEVLLQHAGKVVAIEKDKRLIPLLEEKFAGEITNGRLELIYGDILEERIELPKNYKLIANIPYYITGALFRMFLEAENKPNTIVFLVQKEVAERINSKDGQHSKLSVFIQNVYKTSLGPTVTADNFTPPPKVDSRVIILNKREQPAVPGNLKKEFSSAVRAGFSEKRKKLRSSLSGGLQISKEDVDLILKKTNINPNSRAQELSIKNWIEIASNFTK